MKTRSVTSLTTPNALKANELGWRMAQLKPVATNKTPAPQPEDTGSPSSGASGNRNV